MTMMNHTATSEAGVLGRLRGLWDAMGEARARRRVYNETLRELSNLSSRDLEDLGISRGMISRIAYEAAYGA